VPLILDELIVTQHHLRYPREQIEDMVCFMVGGGRWTRAYLDEYARIKKIRPSPLIQVSVFEDGKKYLHDGHHRGVATVLGERLFFDDDEFEIRKWTYAEYLEINFAVGWVTPFDPRTHVRHADFGKWKKAIQEVALSDPARAVKMIEEQRSSYLLPRKYNGLTSLAHEILMAGEEMVDDVTFRRLKAAALRKCQGAEHGRQLDFSLRPR
jgi:hypothetical protein